MDWPGKDLWMGRALKRGWYTPQNWMGSLITAGRDPSGQYYRRNRYYDAETGRFTQEDPIGLAGGLNLYGYADGDPVNFHDPFGLCSQAAAGDTIPEVEVCSAVADIPGNVFGLKHLWLRTADTEAGLGQAGGGVPGEGDYVVADNSPYFTQTEITDHSGRGNQPGATCRPVSGVSASCVNNQLQIGQSRGSWHLLNQCQTFVRQTLAQCATIPMQAQRDATNVARPRQ